MGNVDIENISGGLYCIHSTLAWNSHIVIKSSEGNIVVSAPDMLKIMDWCQHNIRELEEEARKMNRRIERRNRKREAES
jgi:hypothetical protein